MIAWINGIMVQGTPEEIEHYRGIVAEKSTSTGNQVPEHVKNYFNKPSKVYNHEGEHGHVWFGAHTGGTATTNSGRITRVF